MPTWPLETSLRLPGVKATLKRSYDPPRLYRLTAVDVVRKAIRVVRRQAHARISEVPMHRLITTMTQPELETFHRKFSDQGPVWSEFRVTLPDDD